MNADSKFESGLGKTTANFCSLTPLSFLGRTAKVHPHLPSVIYEDRRFTWGETYDRCRRVASFLSQKGVGRGDTVAALLPNVPAMYELHFAVPMTGAVLNALNIRLNAEAIAFMLKHGEAKVVFVDPEFEAVLTEALGQIDDKPLVIRVDDAAFSAPGKLGDIEYETIVRLGEGNFAWLPPVDEWDAIALSYTSGTTGDPKGVVTHHRGAYLNAVSNLLSAGIFEHPVYLWTLPLFHCNGWCFPWSIAAAAGTNICLRKVDPQKVFQLVDQHSVTLMCGAPIVYSMLINSDAASKRTGQVTKVKGLVAGASPPMAMIEGAERIGIELVHAYGLTEVYGPAAVCAKQPGWDELPAKDRARLMRRQGVPYHLQEDLTVLDPQTMKPVPADGTTIGEVMFRGNIVMKGYLKNKAATDKALEGGWFHTGDLGVVDQDGYVTLKDRSKDIIISGGENVSSVEVEDVLFSHPAVSLAAVVALPDAKWGEVPCAFVELKDGATVSSDELLRYCREALPGFKAPKKVIFGQLPKTSTGKIQKFELRKRVNSASAILE